MPTATFPRTGQSKKCGIGTKCKFSCINDSYVCTVGFASKAAAAATKAKALIVQNNVDVQVGLAGTAASIAGGAVGGPLGALASELAISLATRKANQDVRTVKSTHDKLKREERYQRASKLEKLRLLAVESRKEALVRRRDNKKDLVQEAVGFGIGNAAAKFVPGSVPMKGAIVAMATLPTIMAAIDPYIT